ncbi:MAG: caspase family protein [Xanthobacteraceae bacterium]
MLTQTATRKKPIYFTALAAVLGLWLVLIATAAARAERKVAFVVGNSAYQHADYLPNPIKDAQAMAEKFKQAGFEVVSTAYDNENLQFKRAIRHFEDIATGADIAVVYYAGHGIEVGGVNYLIPVDAKLASDRDIEDETIALGRLVVTVEGAKRLRLVILDACRDNPFIKMRRERVARTRQISPGLGAIAGTGTDTLVAYAARDGTTAEDGFGENSPFTSALLKHLFTPGLDVRLAFGRVRDAVLESTGKRQEPYVYGSLGKETVSLVPAPVKVAVNPEEQSGVKADYQLVERIGSKRAWEVFLKQYPSGFYSDLARQQIDRLAKEASPKLAALEPPKPAAPPAPSSDEQRAWDRIKDSSDEEKLRSFIKRYPASVLANTARLRLDALERAAEERDARARAETEKKAAERARLKAERERKRAEEERVAKAAAEAARQKAEREAALKLEKAEREAKLSAEAKLEAACKREEARLAALKTSGTRSLGDLRRLSEELTCDRMRPTVMAALDQATKELEAEKAVPVPAEPPEPAEPVANTPELVRSAQAELVRIGCLDGRVDGIMGNNTRSAIERYLSEQGKSGADLDVTEDFVAALKKASGRVCPLTCSSGEIVEGGRCVAVQKPEPAARDKDDEDKAAARAKARRDDERRERAAARAREREEQAAARARAREERAARRRARQDDDRAASRRRSKREATQSRSRPRVKQQASASRRRASGGGGGGGVGAIGVGF